MFARRISWKRIEGPVSSFNPGDGDHFTVVSLGGRLLKRTAARIPHDFRRTAVRNLELAGVPRSIAMEVVGHKTESVYRRYAIGDAKARSAAAEALGRLHEAQKRDPGAKDSQGA